MILLSFLLFPYNLSTTFQAFKLLYFYSIRGEPMCGVVAPNTHTQV